MHLAIAEAGQVMGSMIDLSTPLRDLLLGAQSGSRAHLGLAGTALVLSTGLYQLPLAALVNSYRAFPAGGALPRRRDGGGGGRHRPAQPGAGAATGGPLHRGGHAVPEWGSG